MEAWHTGAVRSAELNEDHQSPHSKNSIPLVCLTCRTCFVNFSVQHSVHMYFLSNRLNKYKLPYFVNVLICI